MLRCAAMAAMAMEQKNSLSHNCAHLQIFIHIHGVIPIPIPKFDHFISDQYCYCDL